MIAFSWRALVVGVVYFIAMGVAGSVAPLLGITAPPLPAGADPERLARWFAVSALLSGIAVVLLARGVGGARWRQWLMLSFVVYAAEGINTLLEASIFSTAAVATDGGGQLFYLFAYLWPALAASGAAVWLMPPASANRTFPRRAIGTEGGRALTGVLAFMAIYLGVGALISPLVIEAYSEGVGELVLPPFGRIVLMQGVRGAVFVAACLPVLFAWSDSPSKLVVRLGLALWILLGPVFLLPADWLPIRLRAIHGTEILVDSILFALVLVRLFRERRGAPVRVVASPRPQ